MYYELSLYIRIFSLIYFFSVSKTVAYSVNLGYKLKAEIFLGCDLNKIFHL